VGEADLLDHFQPVVASERDRARGPLADAVEGEHCGGAERRRKEGARRVAEMVLTEDQPVAPVVVGPVRAQLVLQEVLEEKLLA
jgi:hypothetical protein